MVVTAEELTAALDLESIERGLVLKDAADFSQLAGICSDATACLISLHIMTLWPDRCPYTETSVEASPGWIELYLGEFNSGPLEADTVIPLSPEMNRLALAFDALGSAYTHINARTALAFVRAQIVKERANGLHP